MSENFAFIRDIGKMENGLSIIIDRKNNFIKENKWKEIYEIGQLFKNYDVIKMQEIIAKSMIYSAKNYGSRGSSFVIEEDDFLNRNTVAENKESRTKILCAVKNNDEICIKDRKRKPIPENRDLWFEKVWNKYKAERMN